MLMQNLTEGGRTMYNALESRAIISYSITTKSDLHIGGPGSSADGAKDAPILKVKDPKDPQGRAVIPGSSLKGVLRTELERLLKGLGVPDICTVPNVCGKPGTPHAATTCLVCQLFGGMNLAGSVRIHDAVATSAGHMRTRDHVAIDRKVRKARDTAKFDMDAVIKGTKFEGSLVIENLDLVSPTGQHRYDKLGGFISLIDFFNICSGKIGGAVSRGYGEITISIDSIRIVTAQDYLNSTAATGKTIKVTDPIVTDAKTAWQNYLKTVIEKKREEGVASAGV